MGTSATTDKRVDIALDTLRLMLGDLPSVAEDWPRMSEVEQVSWSLDWDHLMGTYLSLLEQQYHAGALLAEQQAQYRELRGALADLQPLIERLQLYPPAIILGQGATSESGRSGNL